VDWKDWPAVEADIETFRTAVAGVTAEELFLTSPSPGQIGRFSGNHITGTTSPTCTPWPTS
jgi:hypothetical protein